MIIFYEIKKILAMPALWGFIALMTVINIVFAVNGNFGAEIDYINAVNRIAGDKYNTSYLNSLKSMRPQDENSIEAYYHEDLVNAAESFPGGLTAKYFSEEFTDYAESKSIKNMPFSKQITSLMGKKYEKIKAVAAQKNASGEFNSVAFGSETGRVFNYASGTLGVLMVSECALTGMLIVLFTLSYENLNATDMIIYSAKCGRRKIFLYKLLAALAVLSLIYVFVFATGYGIFFLQNNFSDIWDVPVSAFYNQAKLNMATLPVIAWDSLTFGGYFALLMLLGFFAVLVFFAFSAFLGLLMKNTFAAFGIAAISTLVNIALMIFPPASPLVTLLVYMFPAGIIGLIPVWFQCGGTLTLIPYQETVMIFGWLAVIALACIPAVKYFTRKDIK